MQVLDNDGAEHPDEPFRVRGRTARPGVSVRGFWWRAYRWENWLVACVVCNSAFKLDFYPLVQDPPPNPLRVRNHSALLLNPYDDDPDEHLEFDGAGGVSGVTRKGCETIRICGLNTNSLVKHRANRRRDVDAAIGTFQHCLDGREPDQAHAALKQLIQLAQPQAEYAGFVRGQIRVRLGLTWGDLQAVGRGVLLLNRVLSAALDDDTAREQCLCDELRGLVNSGGPSAPWLRRWAELALGPGWDT